MADSVERSAHAHAVQHRLVVPAQCHISPAAHGIAPHSEVGVDGGDPQHAAPVGAAQARAHFLLVGEILEDFLQNDVRQVGPALAPGRPRSPVRTAGDLLAAPINSCQLRLLPLTPDAPFPLAARLLGGGSGGGKTSPGCPPVQFDIGQAECGFGCCHVEAGRILLLLPVVGRLLPFPAS